MSLQVCHCGWSKVTTYHGLITHQGKMGCTSRGVKVEESEQQYMWGHIELTNNQKDFELDLYTSIETGEFCTKFPPIHVVFSPNKKCDRNQLFDYVSNTHNRLLFRQEPPDLSMRLVQSYDLPGPENPPRHDGMHAKGCEG